MQNLNSESQRGILVVSYIWSDDTLASTANLLSKAYELSKDLNCKFNACIFSMDVKNVYESLNCFGANNIFLLDHWNPFELSQCVIEKITEDIIDCCSPDIVLFQSSKLINDIAAKIAAKRNTGLTADCIDFQIDKESKLLLQIRSAYEGDMIATIICPEKRPQMATVRLGSSEKKENKTITISNYIAIEKDLYTQYSHNSFHIKEIISNTIESDPDSEIYISIGRGACSNVEVLNRIYELSRLLGAKVVATRAVVDEGILDYSYQVGMTGKSIEPKIYIACGISGALQHMTGVRSAQKLIAINRDANADIFKICDYGIIGTVEEVIPMMIDEFHKIESNNF